jgi:S-adenosylmethionine hydrolase
MQIVSLTTAYGLKDYYVAELKASLLANESLLNIVDISHQIEPFDIVQASFFIRNVWSGFPRGTIHIVAVNSIYKKGSEQICFERDGHFFVGPNNGLFSLVFEDIDEQFVAEIIHPDIQAASTHMLYAYAVSSLVRGFSTLDLGKVCSEFTRKLSIQPVVTGHQIRATIIHIDHFGNVVINLTEQMFEKVRGGRRFQLYYKPTDPITELSRDYGDVPVGDAIAFFNPVGYLELALNMERASDLLNLQRNEMVQINFL